MATLYVNGKQIQTDRHGNPNVNHFCQELFKSDLDKQYQAASLIEDEYIYDVTDFLDLIHRKMKIPLKDLSSALDWRIESSRRQKYAAKPSLPIPDLTPFLQSSSSDENDDDDNVFDFEVDLDDDEEDHRFMSPPKIAKKPKSAFVRQRRQRRLLSFEDRIRLAETNSKVLTALGSFYNSSLNANTGVKQKDDFTLFLKNAAIPYIDALKQLSPLQDVLPTAAPYNQPEIRDEELLSVSQRLRQLGLDPSDYSVSTIGKRALELYKERYPGCSPPQRLVANEQGHEYLMNVYTPRICAYTIDQAMREVNARRR